MHFLRCPNKFAFHLIWTIKVYCSDPSRYSFESETRSVHEHFVVLRNRISDVKTIFPCVREVDELCAFCAVTCGVRCSAKGHQPERTVQRPRPSRPSGHCAARNPTTFAPSRSSVLRAAVAVEEEVQRPFCCSHIWINLDIVGTQSFGADEEATFAPV